MAFKFITLFALFAAACAGIVPAAPVYHSAPASYATYAAPAAVVKAAPAAYATYAAPATYASYAAPATYTSYAAPHAVVKSAPVAYHAQPVLAKASDEYDPHPQYKFSYDVQDSISGDSKNQVEERDGDVVRGQYSLIDADGYKRTVHYTADSVNGFNAVVNREPLVKAVAPVVKTVAAPVTYAAPAVVKHVAPVATYAAPAYYKQVAPVATYAVPAHLKHVAPVSYSAPAYANYAAPAYATYGAPAYTTYHH